MLCSRYRCVDYSHLRPVSVPSLSRLCLISVRLLPVSSHPCTTPVPSSSRLRPIAAPSLSVLFHSVFSFCSLSSDPVQSKAVPSTSSSHLTRKFSFSSLFYFSSHAVPLHSINFPSCFFFCSYRSYYTLSMLWIALPSHLSSYLTLPSSCPARPVMLNPLFPCPILTLSLRVPSLSSITLPCPVRTVPWGQDRTERLRSTISPWEWTDGRPPDSLT